MRHTPVLLQEVISEAGLTPKSVFVDCNLGDGGHTQAVIEHMHGKVSVVGIDLDQDAIDRATENIFSSKDVQKSGFKKEQLFFFRKNFRHLKEMYASTGLDNAQAVLFDLGISSYELQESGRGFSFLKEEPLSMMFGTKEDHHFTAYDIINTWDEENIRTIIQAYGEDKFALRIARALVEQREHKPILTTSQLADIVKHAVPSFARFGRIHPATKTFQALRIAVNDELRSIEDALPQAFDILKKGGRLLVISYHSLEDRIAKRFCKRLVAEDKAVELSKKPITPCTEELEKNPRSRSAKLRIIEKLTD
ncbi:MAG: ribosomal small subunit methyltransferase [Candidatus Parcubacteria bacterium]|jgi:16S rRNA (cytosine1402-N4)-methyltransferase